ncbi:MAG: alanine racemase [Clostridiales bacterium]|nr:alanine racemase [Clostridiales bacterium]
MREEQIRALLADWSGPAYVFDLAALRTRLAFLRRSLPEDISLCYAVKANPFVAGALAAEADRFEVCSPGEYRICQREGVPPEKLVISGVYKDPDFIRQLVRDEPSVGVYTAESPEQFRLLCAAAEENGRTLRVLLRLTAGSQFGMDEDDLCRIVRNRADRPHIDLRGIQFFSGTQKRSAKRLRRELDRLDELLERLENVYGYRAAELEYGAGLPVCYFQGEDFDEPSFLAECSELLTGLRQRPHITLELGRSIAASCGQYLTRVVDAKRCRGQRYAILDGGMNHLVYYGQTMAMRVPHYALYPPRPSGGAEPWNLCGALCTTNDIVVKQLPVPGLAVGDLFLFDNTGAYSMTEGLSLFLSRDLPRVYLLEEDGSLRLVREAVRTDIVNGPMM